MNDAIFKSFADNPAMMAAVKSKILEKLELSAVKLEGLDDKRLGEAVRARITGVKAVEDAFSEIEKFKSPVPVPERINGAR